MIDNSTYKKNHDAIIEFVKTQTNIELYYIAKMEICTHTSELSDMRHLMNLRQAKIV